MHTDHPFTEKQDVFQLPDFAAGPYSVICDFDGTVTPFDVTDAILERFARPAWKTIEDEWVRDAISARQCMERQIPLIEAPLERLDAFLDTVPVTGGFVEFVRYGRSKGIPLGIVSDGMDYPIKRVLNRHGLRHVPVVANRMVYREGAYRLEFPYGREGCASGVCKCGVAEAVPRDGLGGRQDLAHRRWAFRLLSGALGLVHAGPAGQGPAPPLCRRRVSVFHLS